MPVKSDLVSTPLENDMAGAYIEGPRDYSIAFNAANNNKIATFLSLKSRSLYYAPKFMSVTQSHDVMKGVRTSPNAVRIF